MDASVLSAQTVDAFAERDLRNAPECTDCGNGMFSHFWLHGVTSHHQAASGCASSHASISCHRKYRRPLMLLAVGNPFFWRHRHSVTALMSSILRSVGPVTHWDSCAAASLFLDARARRSCRVLSLREPARAFTGLSFCNVPPLNGSTVHETVGGGTTPNRGKLRDCASFPRIQLEVLTFV
jgi:hypothetical protein